MSSTDSIGEYCCQKFQFEKDMRKTFLYIALIAIILSFLPGCGPLPSGRIIRKEFVEEHTEVNYQTIICGNTIIQVPMNIYIPDKYYFHFERGRREVGKETFEKFHEGDMWGVEQ